MVTFKRSSRHRTQNCCHHCTPSIKTSLIVLNRYDYIDAYYLMTSLASFQMLDRGIWIHLCRVTFSKEAFKVPKFRCLPSAILVSWNPWLGSWLMRRVSSWQAMLFPCTRKYRNKAFSIPSFERWVRTRPSRSSVCSRWLFIKSIIQVFRGKRTFKLQWS